MSEKTDTRELFPDWPWEQWDRDQKEADRRRHERMSNVAPDWYDTPGGIVLGWLVIGAVAAGVVIGLFAAPITTLLIVIAAALVLNLAR